MPMGEESLVVWQNTGYIGTEAPEFELFERDNKLESNETMISFDTILPDDMWEKIFSFLPIASIIRGASVCKRWYEIVHSGKNSWLDMPPQKPWYYLLAYNLLDYSNNIEAYSYDASFGKWYSYDFLSLDKYNWLISSSCGLVCFMDYENENKIYTSNPILRDCKQLPNPPNGTLSDHNALALSVDKFSQYYQVALVKINQSRDDFIRWDFTIQIFESKSCLWRTLVNEVLVGWRGERESVICDGILYCLISSCYASNVPRYGLIMYNINSKSLCNSSMQIMIMVPCPLTFCHLMNLRDRLVMVGGIARLELPVRIEGIGIWTLKDEEWEEVARIPRKLLQRFGEFDDFFASCGAEDLIFIYTYVAPTLLIFDMTKKQWEWTTNCPITKRSPLQVFTGFCFQPSLEIKS